jgi:hypothetical protein
VPVSYTASAAVTATLGAQTVKLTESMGKVFKHILTPPIVSGAFIITVTADGQTTVAIGSALIDPDGYVFDKNVWDSQGIVQTLSGVTVTCEYFDAASEWVTWPTWAFDNQANPQVTGADGYYWFFVPPGMYRLTATHPDYWPYHSPDLVVVDAPARLNIPLVLMRRMYLPIVLRNP